MAEPETGDVTQILARLGAGQTSAAEELLPLLYDELRRLARARVHRDRRQTLTPTTLVHEAYLRLVGSGDPGWQSRAHFFGAAAEAMRRILAKRAQERRSARKGGDRRRLELLDSDVVVEDHTLDLVALDDALGRLEELDGHLARIVNLRFFAGLTVEETAQVLDLAPRTVIRQWAVAKAWLRREISGPDRPE